MRRRDADEADLARELGRCDPAALGRVYDLYAARIYAYVRSLGAAPSLAEDVLQEVFVKLATRSGQSGAVKSLKPYLFAAARNELRRWSTRLLRRGEIRPGHLTGLFEVAAPGVPADEAAALEDALSELPAAQREVVVMKVYGGLTFAEIAEVMQRSVNTTASRYRYALEKLKSLLS